MAIDPKININENQIVFRRDGGHNHDGIRSNLIDYTRYSIFDFVPAAIASPGSPRRTFQNQNELRLKTFIVSAVEERVLNPQGIRVQANAITAREIAAGTISANELSSNIVLVNNIIRSNNYVGNVSGWSIFSNGNAEFNNVKIRGELLTGAGLYATSNTPLFANATGYFSLGDKITWDGSSLVINGTVTLSGTNIGTFDNGDALTGGSIGGLSITPSYIGSTDFDGSGQGFRVYSNGFADFNEVSVRGEIVATSGDIGGVLIGSSSISSSGFNGTTTGFALYSNGVVNFRQVIIGNNATIGNSTTVGNDVTIGDRLTVGGNAVIGNVVRINEPSSDGTTTLKVRGGGSSVFVLQNSSPSDILSVSNSGVLTVTGRITTTGNIVASGDITSSATGRASQFVSETAFFSTGNAISNAGFPTALIEKRYNSSVPTDLILFRTTNIANTIAGRIRLTSDSSIQMVNTSDARLKANILTLGNALETIGELRPVSFNYLSDDETRHGFIAQEVNKVYPLAVYIPKNEEEFWMMDYLSFTPVIIAGIKELMDKVENLETRLQTLEDV
jgi:acetyltransferase-like isoleucine patch superfamily enzyme